MENNFNFLKSREDTQIVRTAIKIGRDLDRAEECLREEKPAFGKNMDEIKKRFGLTLWHNVDNDDYFWETKSKEKSIVYPDRAHALHALLFETIEWKDV